jgi:hypothetical protein
LEQLETADTKYPATYVQLCSELGLTSSRAPLLGSFLVSTKTTVLFSIVESAGVLQLLLSKLHHFFHGHDLLGRPRHRWLLLHRTDSFAGIQFHLANDVDLVIRSLRRLCELQRASCANTKKK